jgi:hypothetical protein
MTSTLQEKPSVLKKEHPTLFLIFSGHFFTPDPDPADQNPPGSKSTTLGAGMIEK